MGLRRKAMFQQLFNGRYGIDPFSIFLIIFAFLFFGLKYLWIISLILIVYAVFRAFSKNIDKRQRELQKFNDILRKTSTFMMNAFQRIRMFFQRRKAGRSDYEVWESGSSQRKSEREYEKRQRAEMRRLRRMQKKEYIFVKCPNCKKMLRLPRGKGKLIVTCPTCRTEFYKKT